MGLKHKIFLGQLFILLLLITILPIVDFPFFVLDFEFSKYVVFLLLSAILFFLNGISFIVNKEIKLSNKKILLPAFLFILIFGISTFLSIDPLNSFISRYGNFYAGFWYLLLLFNIFFTAFQLKSERALFLNGIFISGVAVSFYGIWQYAIRFLSTKDIASRVVSSIGQPNRLAFFLIALIPIGYFLTSKEERPVNKLLYCIGWLVTLLCFFFTFSRTTFISLLTLFFFYIVIAKTKNQINKIPKILAIIFLFLIITFGLIAARTIPSTIRNYSQSSLILRTAEWQTAWKGIKNRNFVRQLIGYGPDTAYISFFKNRSLIYNSSAEEFATGPILYRNYYLNILSTIGLLGLVSYLLFFLAILRNSYDFTKKEKNGNVIFYSLLGISLTSVIYYQTDLVMIIFFLLAGLTGEDIVISLQNKIRLLLAVFMFAFGVATLIMGIRFSLAQYYFSSNRSEDNMIKTIKFNPLYDVYYRNLSLYYFRLALKDKNNKTAETQKNIDLAIKYAKDGYNLVPLDLRNIRNIISIQYQFGVLYDKRYQKDNLIYVQKMINAAPTDSRSYDLAGLVYLNLGDLVNARKNFEKEITLVENSPTPYLHLGEVAKQQGFIQEALKFHQKAVDLSPGWNFAVNELNKTKELLLKK